MKVIRQIYDWMGTKVHSSYGLAWLAVLFFIEASFFIVPVDPLLILFCIEDNRRSFFYAAIATIASVAGGVFGYFIGAVLWESIGINLVNWLISEETFNGIVLKYQLYDHWAILIGGFTPIPYKAVTISAGFCNLSLFSFVFYSTIARGARFFMVAGAIRLWGAHIKNCIDRYFNYLVLAFVVIFVMSCTLLKGG